MGDNRDDSRKPFRSANWGSLPSGRNLVGEALIAFGRPMGRPNGSSHGPGSAPLAGTASAGPIDGGSRRLVRAVQRPSAERRRLVEQRSLIRAEPNRITNGWILGDRVSGLDRRLAVRALPRRARRQIVPRLNVLVSRAVCAEVARDINVSERMRLGKQAGRMAPGQRQCPRRHRRGFDRRDFPRRRFEPAKLVVQRLWAARIGDQEKAPKHPKSALQEGPPPRPAPARLRAGRPFRGSARADLRRPGFDQGRRRRARRRHDQAGSGNGGGRGFARTSERARAAASSPSSGRPTPASRPLVNALVGRRSRSSAKARTTATRLMGVAIHGEAQILCSIRPGSSTEAAVERAMVAAAWGSARTRT